MSDKFSFDSLPRLRYLSEDIGTRPTFLDPAGIPKFRQAFDKVIAVFQREHEKALNTDWRFELGDFDCAHQLADAMHDSMLTTVHNVGQQVQILTAMRDEVIRQMQAMVATDDRSAARLRDINF